MIGARTFMGFGLTLALLGFVVGVRDELGPGLRTASALASVIPGSPPTLLTLRPPPRVTTLAYTTRDGYELLADLYEPSDASNSPAIVLVNGVVPEGRDYQVLVDFADGLARTGFVVLVPDALDYPNYRVFPEDIGVLVRGFQALQSRPSVDPDRVGFIGFSMGGSLAMVAAADPEIADQVALVATIGAYYALDAMLRAVTTSTVQAGNGFEPYEPDSYVWLVTRNTLLSAIPDEFDQEALFHLFSLQTPEPDPEELPKWDLGRLGAPARGVYELFTNRDPAAVTPLMDHVRSTLPGVLESISPDAHISRLQAPVALLHDRGDLYVPAQESLRIFDRLGGEPRAQLAVLDVIQHAQLSAPDLSPPVLLGSFLPGMWALWHFTYDALSRLSGGSHAYQA
ncbi:MAG: dienelactone hydrolase family protein [Chloroflexota bacterium]|nr:dienelactone hydrolase family protein [Chloroflexota bacterium]